jgi:hypothetical protein
MITTNCSLVNEVRNAMARIDSTELVARIGKAWERFGLTTMQRKLVSGSNTDFVGYRESVEGHLNAMYAADAIEKYRYALHPLASRDTVLDAAEFVVAEAGRRAANHDEAIVAMNACLASLVG